MSIQNQLEQAAALLKKSKRILFITGAGISADSGLPTYRGVSGLYENRSTDEGVSIEEALSGSMLKKKPEITWKYISQIEKTCRGKSYNRGHEVIADMESGFEHVCVLTQNVDGFHHKAGSKNVIDIHGDISELYCMSCEYAARVNDYSQLSLPPSCPQCGQLIRPDVVLFEELLSSSKVEALSNELREGFDLIFSIGTTSVFPYISRPVIDAYRNNIPVVEINPASTTVSQFCKIKIAEKAAKTLNALWMLRHG